MLVTLKMEASKKVPFSFTLLSSSFLDAIRGKTKHAGIRKRRRNPSLISKGAIKRERRRKKEGREGVKI